MSSADVHCRNKQLFIILLFIYCIGFVFVDRDDDSTSFSHSNYTVFNDTVLPVLPQWLCLPN